LTAVALVLAFLLVLGVLLWFWHEGERR